MPGAFSRATGEACAVHMHVDMHAMRGTGTSASFSLTYLETSMEHFLTLKTKEALAVALVIHHLFSLA